MTETKPTKIITITANAKNNKNNFIGTGVWEIEVPADTKLNEITTEDLEDYRAIGRARFRHLAIEHLHQVTFGKITAICSVEETPGSKEDSAHPLSSVVGRVEHIVEDAGTAQAVIDALTAKFFANN